MNLSRADFSVPFARYRSRGLWSAIWILLLCAVLPAQAERIRSFDVELHVNQDSSLTVAENILVDFESSSQHGIYRLIPLQYKRFGNAFSVELRVQSVTGDQDRAAPYTAVHQDGDIMVKVGDPERLVTGVHTYKIRYVVRRAVNFFQDAPEVYWNATGNGWPLSICSATVRLYPPPGVAAADIRTACYVGSAGSREPGTISQDGGTVLYSSGTLGPGQGLTIVAGLPKGAVIAPSLLEKTLWFLFDWWPLFALPALTTVLMVRRWWHSGRDPGRHNAVAVEWSPPKELSPAEVGTLLDERCDLDDVLSTLIDLAARGYLQIKEREVNDFLFFSSKDYEFIKLNPPAGAPSLLPHEQAFLSALFEEGESLKLLSDLKCKFYVHLPEIRKSVYKQLAGKRYFVDDPDKVRSNYYLLGVVIVLLGCVSWPALAAAQVSIPVGALLSGGVVLIMARAMPARTAKGSGALEESLGFQRYVRLAEKDRIAVLAAEDPTVFGRLLPYAMVLGVADYWANAFHDLLTQPPDWYVPARYGPSYRFSSRSFVHDLGNGMNTIGKTFAANPASTGGGGGSGFAGGTSGGGFGGGGGGSW